MNRRYHSIILISFILVVLISCGGTGGAPGSVTGDTGIVIQSASLARASGPDIDTVQDCCTFDSTTNTCTTLEKFTREDVDLTVITSNPTPDITTAQFPASVQECTITYIKANEDPASPIIEQLTIFPDCPLIEGTNTCTVTLIDIARKNQYATPVFVTHTSVPAEQPTHYVAKYNCSYINNFGQTGQFETEIDIWLSNFNNC